MKIFFKKKKLSLSFIAFLQAAGLVIYCVTIGMFIWQSEKWFGPPFTFLGPTFFLVLFVASALISGLLILGYPVFLFWIKKERLEALKLVGYSSAWLVFFAFLLMAILKFS